MDTIYWTGLWTKESIDSNACIDLGPDATTANRLLFAPRAGGKGVDGIYWSGSAWVTENYVSADTYLRITENGSTTGVVYGAAVPSPWRV